MDLRRLLLCLIAVTAAICAMLQQDHLLAISEQDKRPANDLFDNTVAEILIKRCIRCHNPVELSGALDLTSAKGLATGGTSGPVINSESPNDSRLVELVEHRKKPRMPLDQPRLPGSSIEALKTWIAAGAPYTRELTAPTAAREQIKVDRSFWSFRRLQDVVVPRTNKANTKNPVDAFIASSWRAAKLIPPRRATRGVLIRRLYLDLLGIPPEPDAVKAFVTDDSPLAWPQLVDDVLSRPGYGQRWGRYWLDVVRFAESYGFEHDLDNDNAYHFRDFVIQSWNADQPFDEFIRWQLAGDELAPGNTHARLATGFLAAGPRNADIAQVRVEQERYDELDDFARTIGAGFLGLTIGCARCHDHKFDPLTQREYYEFIKVFDKSIRGEVEVVPIQPTAIGKTKALVAGEGLEPLARIYNPGPAFYKDTWMLNRGDVNLKEYIVSPGVPGILTARDDIAFDHWERPLEEDTEFTHFRSSAARWITDLNDGAGPLLARVIANRVWQFHFGRGIVTTPNDFGARGAQPSHPELLEWLAAELVQHDWSLKYLHRLILNSHAYQQISLQKNPTGTQLALFHGFPVRRLDADAIHDSLLAATNQLSHQMYGPSVISRSSNRRAIYYRLKRSQLNPFLRLFDCPDTLQSSGKRPTSTVPSQALALLNSHSVGELMADYATETLAANNNDLARVVNATFRRFMSRAPRPAEQQMAEAFLRKQVTSYTELHSEETPASLITNGVTLLLQASDLASITLAQKDQVLGWSGSRAIPALRPLDPAKPPRFEGGDEPRVRFSPESTPLVLPNNRFRPIGTGDFTFTVRFRIPKEAGNDNQILGTDSFKGQPVYSGFYLQQIGTMLRFATRNTAVDGPQGYLDIPDRFEEGRWFVVSGKREKNTLSLTIDTDFPSSRSRAEASPININNDAPLKVGDIDEDPSGRMHGDISHLLVYHRALTDLEIQQNHVALEATPAHKLVRTPLEMAVADLCQTLACLNEFIYIR